VLPPCLLSRDDVAADGLVLDEQPRLIEQQQLERSKPIGTGDLDRRTMQHIEEQGFQDIGRVTLTAEVEGLEV